MPITRKRRGETIRDNSSDRNVKRQSNRATKNKNVNYSLDNYNEMLEKREGNVSRKNKEKSNFDPKNTTEKIREEDQAEITSVETTIDKSSDLRDYLNVKRQSNRVKNNNNVLASSQKYCLNDIFYDKFRPSWTQTNSESQKVYIIPRS